MRRVLFWISPLLLAASCNNRQADPPTLPPQMAPASLYQAIWGTNGSGVADGYYGENIQGGFTFAAYEVGQDGYGKPFRRLVFQNLDRGGTYGGNTPVDGPTSPYTTGVEVWAKDVTPLQQYGGRLFRLFYPVRLDSSGGAPTLHWPSPDQVTVEVKDAWPWGGSAPLQDADLSKTPLLYQTTALAPLGVYCLQRPVPGLGLSAGGAFVPVVLMGHDWLSLYIWTDRKFNGSLGGTGGSFSTAAGGPYTTFTDGAPHDFVVIFRDGAPPPPYTDKVDPTRVTYNRWYRAFVRGFSGTANPDGSYSCVQGQAGFEEITDPTEIGILQGYVNNTTDPAAFHLPPWPQGAALDPRLLPTPWR